MIMFIADVQATSYTQVSQMYPCSQEQMLAVPPENYEPDLVKLAYYSLRDNIIQRKPPRPKNFETSPDLSQIPLTAAEAKDSLSSIRAAFGFTTKDLAEVLQVERQTIYAWIRDENDPSPENSRRVLLIETYASKWDALSMWPAKLMLRVPVEGTSLFETLCKKELDESQILRIMEESAKQVRDRETERNKKVQKSAATSHANTHFVSEYDFLTLNAYLPE
ncbi:MAG: helix-turn-helix transcriptional regulator [Thermoguttaceae bacterium]